MSSDSMTATLVSLYALNLGDELAAAVSSGSTVLPVTAAVDFPEAGGSVRVNGVTYQYTSADPVGDTVTLATGLAAAGNVGDRVDLINPATNVIATETRALVVPPGTDIDGDDAMDVAVAFSLATPLGEGVRDLATGEQVTVEMLNDEWTLTQVHGQATVLDRCRVTMTTGQEIPDSVYTAVVWTDPDIYDTSGMHSPTINPSRVTIQTTGWYSVVALVGFAGNATGSREVALYKNGVLFGIYDDQAASSTNQMMLSAHDEFPLIAGDYLEVFVYQSSGAPLSIDAGGSFPAYLTVRLTP